MVKTPSTTNPACMSCDQTVVAFTESAGDETMVRHWKDVGTSNRGCLKRTTQRCLAALLRLPSGSKAPDFRGEVTGDERVRSDSCTPDTGTRAVHAPSLMTLPSPLAKSASHPLGAAGLAWFVPLMILIIFLIAPVVRGQTRLVVLPPCSSGPEIYRNVARERDAGLAAQTQFHTAIASSTPEGHRRSVISTDTHNKLVRQIYAHTRWTPDEVARRWLDRCKAYESRAGKDDHPVVVVDSLE